MSSQAFDAIAGCLIARHSCRAFRPEPLPHKLLEQIFEAARQTASWCNAQPWQVWVLSDARLDAFRDGLLAQVSASAATGAKPEPDFAWPREYLGDYQDRRRESGLMLYQAVGVARGDREAATRQARENFRFFGAPHVAVVTTDDALGSYGLLDCGAWVHNVMLAATSLGVASIAQAAPTTQSAWIRAHLGIPAGRRVVCTVALGNADTQHPANSFRTPRAALEQTITWLDEQTETIESTA